MPAWRLQEDLLVFHALRMRFHRIGLSHWQPNQRLRSWAVSPLHAEGLQLMAPCGEAEALWLGAWTDDDDSAADVVLQRAGGEAVAQLAVPASFQLTTLVDNDGNPSPMGEGSYHLRMRCGQATQALDLRVLAPKVWAGCSGRPAPPPLDGPPLLPPRLG